MAHNHLITLAEAAKLTKNFRETPLGSIASTLVPIKAEAFDKDAIQEIMDQTGCEEVRIYYGLELEPLPKFRQVLVGVDSNGDDMVNGKIMERGFACPAYCGVNNQLNS